MKRITLLFALAVCSFGLAQQYEDSMGPVPADYNRNTAASNQTITPESSVLITEDFDAGLPAGWSTVVNTGTCDWENGMDLPTGDDFTTPAMFFDDDACGNGAPVSNVELVSDVYDTSGSTTVMLGYDVAFQEAGGGSTGSVEVWDGAAWQQVAFYDLDLDPDIQTESIDITAFSNAALQIRWVYDDGGGWEWHLGVDNFSLDFDGGGGGGGPVIAYGGEAANAMFSSFDITTADDLTSIGPLGSTSFENAGALNMAGDTAWVLGSDGDFWSVDTATGVYTAQGTILPSTGGTWAGMEMDLTTGTLYGLSGNFTVDNQVHVIDPVAMTATALPNPVGMPGGGIALAIDGAGDMWGYDLIDDNFYSIDKTTGVGTIVGNIGFDANFGQGMGYDPNTDTIYMTAFNNGAFQPEFRSVDTATGLSTFIAVIGATNPGGLVQLGWVSMANNTPPVDNDLCADATPIACGETLSGDTSDGNTDTNGGADPLLLSPDEWFVFTSTTPGEIVTVSTCNQAGYDTRLAVWEDCTLANQIAANDDGPGCAGFTSELSFQGDGSSTYYISVDGFNGASGAFDLTITCELPPANDNCDGAIAISCGDSVLGTTINSTDDTAVAPDCGTPTSAPGVWYVYNDTTGLVTDILLSTCSTNTNYDTKISVYTGDCGAPPLTCVAGNDDSPNCTNFQSEVEFQSDGNTTYYILVHGFGGATGDFELTMTCTPVPPPNDMIVNSIDVDEIGVPYTDPAVAMPAATLENGNPTGCNIDGAKGVWYNFTAAASGTATAEIVSPAGASFVVFFKAPDENAMETDLEYFFQIGNQCAPATSANITTEGGQAYYVFVVNDGGVTDIVIDGTLLSAEDNIIEGFNYYPNPTDETLNLTSVEAIEDVAIYNLLGQQVMGLDVNATSTQLDTSSLATGAYIMKVTVNGQVGTYKLIKR